MAKGPGSAETVRQDKPAPRSSPASDAPTATRVGFIAGIVGVGVELRRPRKAGGFSRSLRSPAYCSKQ